MHLANKHPHLFDVGITDVDPEFLQHSGNRQKVQALVDSLHMTGHVNSKQQSPKYRYIINTAAVLSSWRLSEMLTTGSVLLLQESSDYELIYAWLTPWEHYVPINQGMGDLVDKIEWLEQHPDVAEAIAKAGFDFFTRRVRRQDTYC